MWRSLAFLLIVACGNPYEEKASELSGFECSQVKECNGLVYVDCQVQTDGPGYYFDADTEAVISTCGGACQLREYQAQCATMCPPPQWTCAR